MAKQSWNAGAVVRLPSGGPKMTVLGQKRKIVTCQWFDKKDRLQEGQFLAETLEDAREAGR
jgi:uncharacterized protein YodC (DUF2158 family)